MKSYKVALAGNPNVGKSTVFNGLTGMKQHTGNWPGKTVEIANGTAQFHGQQFTIYDLPGTYSLMSHSEEEEVARNFLCFEQIDAAIVVCDATCLERNLNLVLQTKEIIQNVILCINLVDEAKKKNIFINYVALEEQLGIPVVPCVARSHQGLDCLLEKVIDNTSNEHKPIQMEYNSILEHSIETLQPYLECRLEHSIPPRWIALKLLENDFSLIHSLEEYFEINLFDDAELKMTYDDVKRHLNKIKYDDNKIKDMIVGSLIHTAEMIYQNTVIKMPSKKDQMEQKLDHILTSRLTGLPIMVLLLALIFWITIVGANYPSQLLSDFFNWGEQHLLDFFHYFNAPTWLTGVLIDGMYHVLTWVISVMLPPMAIFFPLFTLLEDFGYLPRMAFNLDHQFKKCKACGKQCLTMCMGYGIL